MKLPRRKFLKAGATSVAWLAAVGCDRLPRELRALVPFQNKPGGPFHAPESEAVDPIIHALNRAAFGPRPGDYERLGKLGKTPEEAAQVYLEQQLRPEKIENEAADYAVRRFETLNEPLGELFEYQPDLLHNELMRATLLRAVLSERQLFETMVEFWSDHFNIDPSKGDCRWLKVADDRDVIRKHALGKFPELLRASALSPAMLWYLDGRVNRKRNPDEKPNENYARELLELHTLGVHGGYSQTDVMEVARSLSGWTVRSTEQKPYFYIGRVEFKPELHDFGAKEILGHTFASTDGKRKKEELERLAGQDLDRILQIVTTHPSTALHISTKLCRRFIADDPPETAVKTVAEAFSRTDGDIRETLRTLFATTEFREQRGNKFKRPFTFIVSALRATGARTEADLQMIQYLNRMGHAPFSYPLGTLLWRWNFAVELSENKIKGTKIDLETLRKNAGGDDGLMAHLLGRKASAEEVKAYHDSSAGLALMLASPAFQRC
jgi:uncharacterized protein (DUF1800 family)